jgi:hypothetical protein
MSDWHLFTLSSFDSQPSDGAEAAAPASRGTESASTRRPFPIRELLEASPWRRFMDEESFNSTFADDFDARWERLQGRQDKKARQRARSFYLRDTQPYRDVVTAINAALYLRRPLLITGNPGSGKTSLAYAVADRLGLGPVLEWTINPRTTLIEALSTYSPLARLQDVQMEVVKKVQDYITLGPLGTAFLPGRWPRVLLIDEKR